MRKTVVRQKDSRLRRALVLSGGGARGAYEAGVLRYLFDELPKDLGHMPQIDIVTGTSVGAIHACFVAGTAHLTHDRGGRLARVWKDLNADVLFGSATHELLALPRRVLGFLSAPFALQSESPPERLFGLVNTKRLEDLVIAAIPWSRITPNLREQRLEALSVTATELATGRSVVFVETATGEAPRWTNDESVVARSATIGPAHALASAAIPLLFPAVRVEGSYFSDGGLRLNTPLSPALRLGADRVLVIALRKGAEGGQSGDLAASRIEHFGNPLFLAGKILNALLLDHIESDLAHMRLLNDVLRSVRDTAGPETFAAVNATAIADRGQSLKIVEDLVVRPSADLGLMAGAIAHAAPSGLSASTAVRFVLATLGLGDVPLEADLLSYLFFDSIYTLPLMELGFDDAKRMHDELVAFFSD